MKLLLGIFLLILFLIISVTSVHASMEVGSVTAGLTEQEEMVAQVNLTGLTANAAYYLKGAFQKEGSTNYFGESWNGSAWVKYSVEKVNQLTITTDSQGNWQGELKVRNDPSDSGFVGSGTYVFKVGRYTATGSSVTWSDPFNLELNAAVVSTVSPTSTPGETVTPSISSNKEFSVVPSKTTLVGEEEFSADITLKGLEAGSKYYLKGAFAKSGSTNYFGYTKVGNAWVKNGETYSKQLEVTTDGEGNWTGTISLRADQSDSGFASSGDYIFKVGRYNASGSGPTWSAEEAMKLEKISSISTGSVAPTGKTAKTPTPTKANTDKGSSPKTPTGSKTSTSSNSKFGSGETKVLGASTSKPNSSDSAEVNLDVKEPAKQTTDMRLLLTGGVLLLGGGYFAFQKYRSMKQAANEAI